VLEPRSRKLYKETLRRLLLLTNQPLVDVSSLSEGELKLVRTFLVGTTQLSVAVWAMLACLQRMLGSHNFIIS
jgi:hypothetical protein